MEKIDLLKLNNDELHTVCKQVVRLKKQGKKGSEIADIVGIYETRISQIWQLHLKGGDEALKPLKSGRKPESNMLLTSEAQEEIRGTIITKTPEYLKLAGFLWTLAKICSHVKSSAHKP